MSEERGERMTEPLPSLEAYVAEVHADEAAREAAWRAGVIAGQRLGYCYVGPPLPRTPVREIERWWFQAVECRARARADVWLLRTYPREEDTGERIREAMAAVAELTQEMRLHLLESLGLGPAA